MVGRGGNGLSFGGSGGTFGVLPCLSATIFCCRLSSMNVGILTSFKTYESQRRQGRSATKAQTMSDVMLMMVLRE